MSSYNFQVPVWCVCAQLLSHVQLLATLLPLIKENQTSQVNEWRAFLCMGRRKNPGSLKSFLWCAPQLSGASILFFHILSSSGLTIKSACTLMAARWQVFFTAWVPFRAHKLTIHDSCNCWWLWHPCLLIWQEILHCWLLQFLLLQMTTWLLVVFITTFSITHSITFLLITSTFTHCHLDFL